VHTPARAADEYEPLLDLVRRREIEVIVAYHPDRLYRRLADLVELTKVVAAAGSRSGRSLPVTST
jgi:hypothetical protein